jgi:hypothetical protein
MAYFQPLLSTKLKPKFLQKGKISGMYCDALLENAEMIQAIGMMYDPEQPVCDSDPPITYEEPPDQYFTYLTAPMSGTFGSRVSIKDIATIQACYIGNRCTGLAFTFTMGRIEILGQWFECTGRHTSLFNSTRNKNFKGLRFQLHISSHITVVRSVTILHAHNHDASVEGAVMDAMYSVSPFVFPTNRSLLIYLRILSNGFTRHELMKYGFAGIRAVEAYRSVCQN